MKAKNLLLVAVMLFIAIHAMAQTWNIGYPNEGDVVATLTDGTLVISGTGATKDFGFINGTNIYAPWYQNNQILNVTINDGVTSIGSWLLADMGGLKSVTIPNSVISIGESALRESGALETIAIPNNVKSIGDYAFIFSGLTSISIPNGVIGNYALEDCFSLTSITLGNGVTSVGDWAFAECFSLNSINVLNPNPATISIGSYVFESIDLNNCTLKVPAGAVGLYSVAPVWQNFPHIMDDAGTAIVHPNLAGLTVSSGALSPAFSPTTYNYQVTVPQSVGTIVLTATPMDNNATVSGDGQKTLNTGDNTFNITVTTPSGGTVYTVIVTRTISDYSLSNYSLTFINYSEVATGATAVTYQDVVTGTNKTVSVIDQYQLEYELTTGNFSGNAPLYFNIGNGQATYNTTVSVKANSVYKIIIYLNLFPPQQGDISFTTNFDSFGRPSSVTINYTRQSCEVIASDGNVKLATADINRVTYNTYKGNDIKNISVSSSLVGSFTSIKELLAAQDITVFPNPAVDFVTVSGLQSNETIFFYNINGKLLITRKAAGVTETVPVGNLPSGIYLLKTSNGQTVKWVKK